MNRETNKPKLRYIDLLNITGHFLLILGVSGITLSLQKPEISFVRGLGVAAAISGLWIGAWIMAFRVPPVVLTVCWAFLAVAIILFITS